LFSFLEVSIPLCAQLSAGPTLHPFISTSCYRSRAYKQTNHCSSPQPEAKTLKSSWTIFPCIFIDMLFSKALDDSEHNEPPIPPLPDRQMHFHDNANVYQTDILWNTGRLLDQRGSMLCMSTTASCATKRVTPSKSLLARSISILSTSTRCCTLKRT